MVPGRSPSPPHPEPSGSPVICSPPARVAQCGHARRAPAAGRPRPTARGARARLGGGSRPRGRLSVRFASGEGCRATLRRRPRGRAPGRARGDRTLAQAARSDREMRARASVPTRWTSWCSRTHRRSSAIECSRAAGCSANATRGAGSGSPSGSCASTSTRLICAQCWTPGSGAGCARGALAVDPAVVRRILRAMERIRSNSADDAETREPHLGRARISLALMAGRRAGSASS